jgi:general secretion pathway protein G
MNRIPARPDTVATATPPSSRKGFTMIELIITLAIMATLALVAVPMAQVAQQRAKERSLRTSLIEIREALDAYKRAAEQGRIQRKAGDSGYPVKLEELVEGVPDIKSPNKNKIYFLRRLPRDPFFIGDATNPSDTWSKRSYSSSADSPSEGEDVYDVTSKSGKVGLNGIPLKQW